VCTLEPAPETGSATGECGYILYIELAVRPPVRLVLPQPLYTFRHGFIRP
jgi:hypothetical protein